MSQSDPQADRAAFVAQWKITGPLLEANSVREIRQLTSRQRQQQIDNLLKLGFQFRRPRTDDGLVYLHRILCQLEQIKHRQS